MRKTESIFKMESLGLNTLDCFITKDLDSVKEYLNKNQDKLLSMRTERGYEFGCPFYFMQKPEVLLEVAKKLIDENYTLLLYPALDTKGCLCFGTIGLAGNGDTVLEFVEGPGKVRELDVHPNRRSIVLPPSRMNLLLNGQSNLSRILNEVIIDVHDKCWEEPPCIVEFSYYSTPVGNLKKNQIYWEIRGYEKEKI